MEHNLVIEKLLPDNYPPYRYYEECSCGFQTRMPSKDLADSQFKAHLINNGVIQPPKMLTKEELKNKSTNMPKTSWNPFNKK